MSLGWITKRRQPCRIGEVRLHAAGRALRSDRRAHERAILAAVTELRRHGDTLVRARDRALALDELRPHIAADDVDLEQKANVAAMPHRIAFDHLENALGRTL